MSAVGGKYPCSNYCRLGDAGKSPISMKLSNFTLVLLLPVKSTSILPRKGLWTANSCVIFGLQRIFLVLHNHFSIPLCHLQNLSCGVLVRKLVRAMYGLWSVLVVLKRHLKLFQSRQYLYFSILLCRSQLLTGIFSCRTERGKNWPGFILRLHYYKSSMWLMKALSLL